MDWDGPSDPANPLNWPKHKKAYHSAVPALLCFAVTFGSSVYTPGYEGIEERFNASSTPVVVGLTLYVLGLAFGPVLGAPISELYGRKIVFLVSMPVSMLFTLGVGLSQNLASVLVCRFFAGFVGSPALAVGAGTNADLFLMKDRSFPLSIYLLAPFAGPVFGPLVGGFSVMRYGWRFTQWALLIISGAAYLLVLFSSETYAKVLLQRKAKAKGLQDPSATSASGLSTVKGLLVITLLRPLVMLVREPIVLFVSLYTAFQFAVLFGFFESFPIVFGHIHGFNPGEVGLSFAGIGIGALSSVPTLALLNHFATRERERNAAAGKGLVLCSETYLYGAMLGSFGFPIGIFWFGWTSRPDIHWIVPILAGIPFGWGLLCNFNSSTTYMVQVYGPLYGASALAANGLLRYTFGAVFPLFTTQMYKKLGVPWATSLFGFIAIALLPVPWVLFIYGPKLQAMSSYQKSKSLQRV